MVTGVLPFNHFSNSKIEKLIINADYRISSYFSADLKELISSLLVTYPDLRPSASEILKMKWILKPLLSSNENSSNQKLNSITNCRIKLAGSSPNQKSMNTKKTIQLVKCKSNHCLSCMHLNELNYSDSFKL
jgi:serine/threonine protein kinase